MKSACLKVGLFLTLFLLTAFTWAQTRQVSGTVTSAEEKTPLAGVSILVKGKAAGTQTDANGNYSISAATGDVLVFSFTGFLPQEIKVGTASTINAALNPGTAIMVEVGVVGYGTHKGSKFTGSVS